MTGGGEEAMVTGTKEVVGAGGPVLTREIGGGGGEGDDKAGNADGYRRVDGAWERREGG